ncbi:TniQ family protein [Enterocloster bolteae]|uniref:TniQ family protein n=1 Tax=Enterocloster bolteae TaxID=208479 RepID=UPI00210E1D32|nr:TniQ family protein [Enterocloster bolteae]MCQ5145143.1 TniQ family protein [Enterocloster bolteae]
MLNFFPTPYPGELWYSVLCRYHLRTGNPKSATTIQELFDGRGHAAMGAFFPNKTIYDILGQLPPGLLDIKDIIVNHTLFPYFYRIIPVEKKEQALKELCAGTAVTPTWLWKMDNSVGGMSELRYCPLCRQEDINTCGETYWHTAHQIPLMSACPKHKCKLERVQFRQGQVNEKFFLPSAYCREVEPNLDIEKYEEPLAKTLSAYLGMAFEIGPTAGVNNLVQAFYNKGYMVIAKRFQVVLDSEMMQESLEEFYGPDLVHRCFGEKVMPYQLGRLVNWALFSPERYAMLAAMIGQSPRVTFSPKPIPDKIEEKLLGLSSQEVALTKKDIAAQLGIKTYQLDSLLARYGIEPFWVNYMKRANDGTEAKNKLIRVYYSEGEKNRVEGYAVRKGFPTTSEFARYCINRIIKMDEPKTPGTTS